MVYLCFTACEEKLFTGNVDCNECYYPKPDSVDLVIYWSHSDEFPEIPVLLYIDNIDDGEFIDTFFVFNSSPAYIWVKADRRYAAKAIYSNNERTVYAIDGTNQKLKRVSGVCEEDECWVIENEELFLELAY